MIVQIVEVYILIGLLFVITYMVYVGRLIKNKYGCGLAEGISRFERAGSIASNLKAIVEGAILWPMLLRSMVTGTWDRELAKMVEENDY